MTYSEVGDFSAHIFHLISTQQLVKKVTNTTVLFTNLKKKAT
jgi:hypothetical protein